MNPLLLEMLSISVPSSRGWNPALSNLTLSGSDNLNAAGTGYARSIATHATVPKAYWVEIAVNNTGYFRFGFTNQVNGSSFPANDGSTTQFWGSNDQSIYFPNGAVTNSGAWPQFTTGDVVGLGFDFTSNTVTWRKNNLSVFTSGASNLPTGQISVAVAGVSVNLSLRTAGFTYSPPSGFEPWGA